MQTYDRPMVEELGTVAELVQALGVGPGSAVDYPIMARLGDRCDGFLDVITHS